MQVSIDNAKRRFDVDLVEEIKRIKKDMGIAENNYPSFWGIVKKDFNKNKINSSLTCPMNYLCNVKLNRYNNGAILPMSRFFKKFELDEQRRKCRKVEELIEKYSFDVWNYNISEEKDADQWLLLQDDFDNLIDDIRQLYLSNNYLGLMSWLIDRAFCITKNARPTMSKSTLNKNKVILVKTLYAINPTNLLKVFSKNLEKNDTLIDQDESQPQ